MSIRRFFAAIAVACCVVLASTSWAAAASNGNHDQGYTCTTNAGATQPGNPTTVHFVLSYHVTGIGADPINVVYADQVVWSTSPAVDLDYVIVNLADSSTSSPSYGLLTLGTGGSNSLNDHGTAVFAPGSHYRYFHNGTPGWLFGGAGGGSGNYDGTCGVGHSVL